MAGSCERGNARRAVVFAELKTFVVAANFIILRPFGSRTFTATDYWFSSVFPDVIDIFFSSP
jgi:hypothetical protein